MAPSIASSHMGPQPESLGGYAQSQVQHPDSVAPASIAPSVNAPPVGPNFSSKPAFAGNPNSGLFPGVFGPGGSAFSTHAPNTNLYTPYDNPSHPINQEGITPPKKFKSQGLINAKDYLAQYPIILLEPLSAQLPVRPSQISKSSQPKSTASTSHLTRASTSSTLVAAPPPVPKSSASAEYTIKPNWWDPRDPRKSWDGFKWR
ncbi:hypothetical protein BJ684DRAFT_16172 [Piptocephalis cylindrospora]|uniref:Uncharacterized protein n=1 Tax=Piptocephalis cylindrospora TaxID=1907219 RepID=A0A4P9Y5G4_9FUNG|nr:hypothetical protein BJ684DRAFT_16172 [Piptocephalis cylindrospora]|eukprot:RKP13431.1 hypothetical protein BJ684DRAFT_16172 [Piptocephalis cylindrospora]